MTQPQQTPRPLMAPMGTSMAGGGFAAVVGSVVAGAIVANNPELAVGQDYIAGTVAGLLMGLGTLARRLMTRFAQE